jgi:hypothetical protein
MRWGPPYSPMVAERRYRQQVVGPFGGFFAYQQPAYQSRAHPRGRQIYG